MRDGICIDNLVIEVTRRCNANCDHCLRGEAQDVSIDHADLYKLFAQVREIRTITLSGGEPSLAVERIRFIRRLLQKKKIPVSDFYIVTNALQVNREFVKEMLEWWLMCSDNEMSQVSISNDEFHPEADEEQVKLLHALKFTSFREPTAEKDRRHVMGWRNLDSVIAQGRGAGIGGRHVTATSYGIDFEERAITEGEVYVNALGKIIAGCDFSYDSQLSQEICSVNDDIWAEFVDQYGEDK